MRIAAVGDLHVRASGNAELRDHLQGATDNADALLLCGDLTDHGLVSEAEVLAAHLSQARLPVLAVLGNHDVESGEDALVARLLGEAGVTMLDSDCAQIEDVGFAGVKGFCGGFGQYMLQPWGEPVIKRFVFEAVDEAIKLEGQLAKLHSRRTVVLLHYSPIRHTVEGECPDVIPFLGSSRLAETIDRFDVDVAFHGHSHYGGLHGRTPGGCLVFNCALPLLRRETPETPYVLFDV